MMVGRTLWLSPAIAMIALSGCGESEQRRSTRADTNPAATVAKTPPKSQAQAEALFAKEGIAEYVQTLDLSTVKLSGCKPAEAPSKWECGLWGRVIESQPTTSGEPVPKGGCLFVKDEVGAHLEGVESLSLAEACSEDFALGKYGKRPHASVVAGWRHFARELGDVITRQESEASEERTKAETE